jgi:hypothetical protein
MLRPAQAEHTAQQAAYGVSVFDQQGCVSPQLLYVERGGEVSPRAFAELLAEAMTTVHAELPRGPLPLADSTAIRHLRGSYEFRALADDRVQLLCSEPGTAWTVIYEEEAPFTASRLNRTIRVHPVADIATPARFVPVRAYLQTAVALSASRRQPWQRRWGVWASLGSAPSIACRGRRWPGITTAAAICSTWYAGRI